jgi:hypothetical protein
MDMSPPDMAFPTAPHQPLPQVPNMGGPILAHPKIVTISWPGYPFETHSTAVGDWLASSNWLTTVGAEYGIGTATHTHVSFTTTAPAALNAAAFAQIIDQGIAAKTLPSDGLYVFLLSPETVDNNGFAPSCGVGAIGRRAYHAETMTSNLPYAVIATCTQESLPFFDISFVHEVFEGSVDPHTYSSPAFIVDPSSEWIAIGGELADLCEGDTYIADGFTVQRIWSNAAAAAGTYPCVPAPSTPYFNVSPDKQMVTIPAGGSATVTLTGWSTGVVGAWNVFVVPDDYRFTLGATLDVPTVGNGGVTHLTLSVPAGTRSGAINNVTLTSSQQAFDNVPPYNLWAVQVTVQ